MAPDDRSDYPIEDLLALRDLYLRISAAVKKVEIPELLPYQAMAAEIDEELERRRSTSVRAHGRADR
jgi:hypothetical protein